MSETRHDMYGCGHKIDGRDVKSLILQGDVHLKEYCEKQYYFCDGCEFDVMRR